jgi:hypothetical protein
VHPLQQLLADCWCEHTTDHDRRDLVGGELGQRVVEPPAASTSWLGISSSLKAVAPGGDSTAAVAAADGATAGRTWVLIARNRASTPICEVLLWCCRYSRGTVTVPYVHVVTRRAALIHKIRPYL